MTTRDGFLEYVVDQLSGVENLLSRPMFGGVGLYAGTVFFGIIYHQKSRFQVSPQRREDAKFFYRNSASTTKNSTFVERRHAAASATRAAGVDDSRVISLGKDFDSQPNVEAA